MELVVPAVVVAYDPRDRINFRNADGKMSKRLNGFARVLALDGLYGRMHWVPLGEPNHLYMPFAKDYAHFEDSKESPVVLADQELRAGTITKELLNTPEDGNQIVAALPGAWSWTEDRDSRTPRLASWIADLDWYHRCVVLAFSPEQREAETALAEALKKTGAFIKCAQLDTRPEDLLGVEHAGYFPGDPWPVLVRSIHQAETDVLLAYGAYKKYVSQFLSVS